MTFLQAKKKSKLSYYQIAALSSLSRLAIMKLAFGRSNPKLFTTVRFLSQVGFTCSAKNGVVKWDFE